MAETTLEIVRQRLANGTLSDGDVEELILEIERLRSGIQDMLDRNYPNPRTRKLLQDLIGPTEEIANG